jgi:hypothetical protein
MVFLTITPTILEALEEVQHLNGDTQPLSRSQIGENGTHPDARDGNESSQQGCSNKERTQRGIGGRYSVLDDGSLQNSTLGSPISHGQVIDLWKDLQARGTRPRTLESLLKGSRVYNPPPKPKPEPVSTILPN